MSGYFLHWLEQEYRLSLIIIRQLAKRLLISAEQRLLNGFDSVETDLVYVVLCIRDKQMDLSRDLLTNLLYTSTRHLNKVIFGLQRKSLI